MIANTDDKYFSEIRVEKVFLLTAKQRLRKYKVKLLDVRRTRRQTFI